MKTKPRSTDLVAQVLRLNDLDPTLITRDWREQLKLGGEEGVIAVVVLGRAHAYQIINVPALVFTARTVMPIGAALELVGCLPSIEGARYATSGRGFTFMFCKRIPLAGEEEVPRRLAELYAAARQVREQLLRALKHFYPRAYTQEEVARMPTLPKIKMTPDEAKMIYGVLARCDLDDERLFTYLLEKWTRAGYSFSVIPSQIRLEAPYSDGKVILAMLFPGLSPEMAHLAPDVQPHPPGIEIAWNGLKERTGFPATGIGRYQKAMQQVAKLHITPNWASVENLSDLHGLKASKFLRPLKDLAASVQSESIESPKAPGPGSPANIEETLAVCDLKSRAVFKDLLRGWREVDGTVVCNKPGRIYLKLKTRAHRTGHASRLARNFSLLVLGAPRGKRGAHIDLAFNLARVGSQTAYLDCIPDAVHAFEKGVAALPGFERQGVVYRIVLGKAFEKQHIARLVGMMQEIKRAEAAAA